MICAESNEELVETLVDLHIDMKQHQTLNQRLFLLSQIV